ncbi:MAG: TrpR-like protein YerC/YecD [Clostridia bacterium]|nr:TrpR-like protein YerC/YecD [Clostridia bacterium]
MYRSKFESESCDLLFDAILTLKNREECYRLFEDLCTIHELEVLSQRMAVARLLNEQMTYQDIAQKTQASTATICRINRALNYGSDGYRLVLERMEDKNHV